MSIKHIKGSIVLCVFLSCFFGNVNMQAQVPGMDALPISVPDQYGQQHYLHFKDGNFKLLHFWGSWCPNSTIQIKNLNILHNKYNSPQYLGENGLEFYSVSLDSDKKEWLEGIEDFNIKWQNHYCDYMGFDSPAAYTYNISEVPTTFLISPTGEILGRNLSFSETDNYLTKISKQGGIAAFNVKPKGKSPIITPLTNYATAYTTANSKAYNSATTPNYQPVANKPVVSNANTNYGTPYAIDLGAFPTLRFHDFKHIKDYGNLKVEKTANGWKRVLIDGFSSESQMQDVLRQMQQKGYHDAILLRSNTGTPPPSEYYRPAPNQQKNRSGKNNFG